MIEAGDLELVSSSVLEYENSRNPFSTRQRWVEQCLRLAAHYQRVEKDTRQRALELEKEGVKAVDALHAACAEIAECAYLLTCDDGMVSRYNGVMKVLNPVDFVLAIGAKNNDGKRAE
jgi:predicted nucleic acid-binding protein